MSLGPSTLRTAVATAQVTNAATLADDAVACAAARSAAALAIKQVPFWLASAQPTPAFDLDVALTADGDVLAIELTLSAISGYDLGSFALAGVTAAAVSVLDGTGAPGAINNVSLISSTGGAGQFRPATDGATAVVIVLSDTVAAGNKPDTAGQSVSDGLAKAGFDVVSYEVLPDDPAQLQARLREWLAQAPNLIVTVGGTGVGPRDRTVETVRSLLTAEMPGVMEAARAYGQARTPYSALSRGVAGLSGRTIVATFPGSRRGAEETMEALLTGLVHLVDVVRKTHPHEGGYE